jgi:hypothetical protein
MDNHIPCPELAGKPFDVLDQFVEETFAFFFILFSAWKKTTTVLSMESSVSVSGTCGRLFEAVLNHHLCA